MQMGVSGDNDVFVVVALLDKDVEKSSNGFNEVFNARANKEFQVDEHLVVARASGMDFFADVAKSSSQKKLNLGVHVLNTIFNDEVSAGNGVENVA